MQSGINANLPLHGFFCPGSHLDSSFLNLSDLQSDSVNSTVANLKSIVIENYQNSIQANIAVHVSDS